MHLILLIIAGLVLWPILHVSLRLKSKVICRNCGTCDRTKLISPSNFLIEILLWCSGLVPGVIYTLWCNHVTYNACSKCGSRDIVPVDSPVGQKMVGEHAVDVTPVHEQPSAKQ